MSQPTPAHDVLRILSKAGPYPLAAYTFVQEGLSFTVERVHERAAREHADPMSLDGSAGTDRHVSGQQLCLGLRDHAIEQYGLLAHAVLAHWGIQRTEDFGRMVFAMIDAGAMSKNPNDTLEDFCGVYDFAEAFHPEQLAGALRSAPC
jgi:uncharacterized repeat protein (TIGR04138 family)